MSGRVIWPPRRARTAGGVLPVLRRRPDVRAAAHLLLARWRRPGDGEAELAAMLGNAIELAALRAVLEEVRAAGRGGPFAQPRIGDDRS